jgi:hypothetical protein
MLTTLVACSSEDLEDALADAEGVATAVADSEEVEAVVTAAEEVATAVVSGEGLQDVVTAAEGVATAVTEAGGLEGVARALSGLLEIRVTDAPPEGVTSVVVTVTNIQIHQATAENEDSGWLTLFAVTSTSSTIIEPKTFDLVEVIGIEEVLGVEEIPVGKYTQIRMDVIEVVVTHLGEDKVAELPGDKLKIVRPFDVVADQTTVLTLDFDADESVIITGAGQVRFKPTVKLLIRNEDRGEQPLADVAEATAVPISSDCEHTATVFTSERAQPGSSDLSIEEQKKALIAIVNERLAGFNNKDLPRLKIPPDARDHRQGGIWVTFEFNSDFLDTIPESKDCLDLLMRDTYEALFAAGFDLTWVDITVIGETVLHGGSGAARGRSGMAPAQVVKTRLKRDVAETIDWANKESLDFDEIWDTLLLSPVWRRALQAAQEGN